MDTPGFGLSLLGLLGVVALVVTNAFFVATEFALVAVRRTQVEVWVAEGRRGARAIQTAIEHLDDAIAATQLGITLASIGLGWIGEPALAGLIRPMLLAVGVESSPLPFHTLALTLAFSAITFVHVVAGELAPKARRLGLSRQGGARLCAAVARVWARSSGRSSYS